MYSKENNIFLTSLKVLAFIFHEMTPPSISFSGEEALGKSQSAASDP